jgi:negative regulator of sigma E activity
MKHIWKDEDITKILKEMAKAVPEKTVFQRVWFKVEERLDSRRYHSHMVWHPWLHPVRWVAAAACLCLAFTGVLYQHDIADKNDMAAYLMSAPDPVATVTVDPGMVHVSVLISEPANKAPDVFRDQNPFNPLAGDEIFL